MYSTNSKENVNLSTFLHYSDIVRKQNEQSLEVCTCKDVLQTDWANEMKIPVPDAGSIVTSVDLKSRTLTLSLSEHPISI